LKISTIGEVLARYVRRERAQVLAEIRQSLQVQGVIEERVVRIGLEKAVDRAYCLRRFAFLVERVRRVELRLLGVAAIRKLGLKLGVELGGGLPVAVVQLLLRSLVPVRRLPVLALGVAAVLEQAAARQQGCGEQ